MDNRNFIESGLLESYLLGFTTEEEKKYVDQTLQTDHQAAEYVYKLEGSIQKHFDHNSVPPPPELREIILFRTTKTDIQKKKHVFREASNEDSSKKSEYLDIEVNDTYIKVHKYWRPAFIAVFALSKIFLIAGLYYYFKTTSLEQEVLKLKTEIQQIK